MEPEEILRRLYAAKEFIGTQEVPARMLYDFLKAYEDTVAVLLSDGELLGYIDRRMALAEELGG